VKPGKTTHEHHHGEGRALRLALALTLGFAFVEALGGWWAGSLALMSDAGHMLSDAVALALALFASWLVLYPSSERHSFGLVRAEVIAALVNGLLMLAVITAIAVEAVRRLQAPQPVAGGTVTLIAFLGLLVNMASAFVLSHGGASLNVRAALLHVLGDMLGSVAALVAGAVIFYTGWTPIDPLLSLAVCALILVSAYRLLKEALHVLMEGVPSHVDINLVGETLLSLEGVSSVHELHVWTLASGRVSLSAHLVVADLNAWPGLLVQARRMLHDRFDIEHVTLQPETRMPERNGLFISVVGK
jgi:cobalt-zinc-cadmium efflux system protein